MTSYFNNLWHITEDFRCKKLNPANGPRLTNSGSFFQGPIILHGSIDTNFYKITML